MGHDDKDLQQTLGDLSTNLLWKKVMEVQAEGGQKHHLNSAIMKTKRNPKRNKTLKMIKRRRARRVGQEGSRRSTMVEKKVRTLKKLIPNGDSTVGLDGLFKETAEYISNLQMRVSIMKAVVNALSNSE
ncbi:hypothetical protein L1987_50404 [Smallanthus sonchifolius]|uniref:Uncharacterized protein n=1 Tax=Smallanthus sonchifolius TaxID=185202 RepID=A0ACB9ENI1_9ASTR|nr:hypothetical protein L1987_50404 [Smallanthus sonchifolius]